MLVFDLGPLLAFGGFVLILVGLYALASSCDNVRVSTYPSTQYVYHDRPVVVERPVYHNTVPVPVPVPVTPYVPYSPPIVVTNTPVLRHTAVSHMPVSTTVTTSTHTTTPAPAPAATTSTSYARTTRR